MQIGDLAYVARWHCEGGYKWVGRIFTIAHMIPFPASNATFDCRCGVCGTVLPSMMAVKSHDGYTYRQEDIKIIPPLSELDGLEEMRVREIKSPSAPPEHVNC